MASRSACLEARRVPRFWLDTNVFITPKNSYYSFDLAPGFWSFIDEQARTGEIAAPALVYDELVDRSDDQLARWARERRGSALFVQPSASVQSALTRIADHVTSRYEPNQAADFLKGADPWVIAHAIAEGGIVVTLETKVSPRSTKVKIPNISEQFGVPWIAMFEMLSELGLRL